jgi:hypothetical protein
MAPYIIPQLPDYEEQKKNSLEEELRNLDFLSLFIETFERKKDWLSLFFVINGTHTSMFALMRLNKLESLYNSILSYLQAPLGPNTLQKKYQDQIPEMIFDISNLLDKS